MGKSQTKKRTARHNPIRVPDTHKKSSNTNHTQVIPVLEKFKSANASERVWACAATTNLIANDPSTRRLLQSKGVITLLIERLSDNEPDVINESTGSLRNLCIDGGPEICAEMFNKNVLAPLKTHITNIVSIVERIVQGEQPSDHDEISWRRIIWTWIENIVTIFWCLSYDQSETSNKAFKAVNDLSLPPFLVAFLKKDLRKVTPLSTTIAASQCLFILSEDNASFKKHFHDNPGDCTALVDIISDPFEKADQVKATLSKILSCGIIRNISPLPAVVPAAAVANDSNTILPILFSCLNADLNALSNESESLAANLPAITSKQNNNTTDHKSNEEKRLDEIELVMITLQSSLDVLTGYCSQIPEGDFELNDTEENEAEEMEEEMQEDIDAIIEGDSQAQDNENEMNEVKPIATTSIIPSSLLTLFNPEVELHNKLIKLAYPTSMSLLRSSISATSPHSPTTAHLSVVHLRALEALQNLLLSLARYAPSPSSPTSEEEAEAWSSLKQQLNPTLSQLWAGLFEIGQAIEPCEVNNFTIRTQSARFGCIENLVGCMLGVSKVLGEDLQLQSSEITALINMYNVSTSGALKSKVVGTLGGLARRQDKIEDNRIIGNFLIDLLNKLPQVASQATDESTTAEVAIAILNELFDIYADENSGYDVPVFRNDQFLNKLRAVVPLVRTCARSVDRKFNPELRATIDEAYQNFLSFIRYRQSVA
ncbi:ARM repeat-containing protein [Wallemia mellicola]|uniref:ARM repeat-containing protein n=1 Tax=Wallemia mellicola TaxID=1708541 RepID=A0A4T0MET6_9BASI|nr:ARM repeat-containing protein [Wallemia mellicola]TIC16761.1 ARM repeat-containing protein [Wallemia mellicola]TIC55501.1 ARM repeat-containing protein [Wallemia mellicola]